MKLSVEQVEQVKVEQVQFVNMNKEVVYSVCNRTPDATYTGTFTVNSGPEQNPIITEAVRKTVLDYGETLRKLSNE